MTAQSIYAAERRSRRRATHRLPVDLVVLVLILVALYLAARFLPPHLVSPAPAPNPVALEAPTPVEALPALPALDPTVEPIPLRVRRTPTPIPIDPVAAPAEHDPFAGLEPLSAQELAAISQAR